MWVIIFSFFIGYISILFLHVELLNSLLIYFYLFTHTKTELQTLYFSKLTALCLCL